ncbi:MAG: TIGR01212 family radical SAM protein [Candidatus Omnitrophota bacterium]
MHYYTFSKYLREKYGTRVHRLSLNAGFSCPAREKARAQGGCIFCNEAGFSPFSGTDISLEEQIERSMKLSARKYGAEKFIAYFQSSTNTNASQDRLKTAYDVIRKYPDIVALYISTRPDCIDDAKLDLISEYMDDYEVWIEYGIQTSHDNTLKKINRGHTFSESISAVNKTCARGIKVGGHIILGLPGESREDMIVTAKKLSEIPVAGIKLHVLHVLRDTKLEVMYREDKIKLLNQDQYVAIVCDFLEYTRAECIIFRVVSDANKDILVAPDWINHKGIVLRDIEKEFSRRGTHQGASVSR